MTAIARAAGVGRVTLYAHFPSREALLDAGPGTRGRPGGRGAGGQERRPRRHAGAGRVGELLGSSWEILDHHRRLMVAAARHLGPVRLRERHTRVLAGVEHLIARGQDESAFRADVPWTGWSPSPTACCTPRPKRSTPNGSRRHRPRRFWSRRFLPPSPNRRKLPRPPRQRTGAVNKK